MGCGCRHEKVEMSELLFIMANKAWNALMIEKMKKVLQETVGERMDKGAKAAVENCLKVWDERMKQNNMDLELSTEEKEVYRKKLDEIFRA